MSTLTKSISINRILKLQVVHFPAIPCMKDRLTGYRHCQFDSFEGIAAVRTGRAIDGRVFACLWGLVAFPRSLSTIPSAPARENNIRGQRIAFSRLRAFVSDWMRWFQHARSADPSSIF